MAESAAITLSLSETIKLLTFTEALPQSPAVGEPRVICNNGENLICTTDAMLSDNISSVIGDVMVNQILFLGQLGFYARRNPQ